LLFGRQGEIHADAERYLPRAGNVPPVAESFEVSGPDGRKLEAIAEGPTDGTLVVLHHGTPGSAGEIWPPHIEGAEARGLRLAAYSRPGGAGSDRHPGRTVADCTADAAVVADHLGADRFYTLGGSGGGPHALACAAVLPDRVIAAATIASVAPFDAEGLDWSAGMGEENIQEFDAARAGEKELEAFLNGWLGELREITGDQVLESLGDLVSEPDAAVLTGEFAEFSAASIRDALRSGIWGWFDDDVALLGDWRFDLSAIQVPVTLWHGSEDRFVPPPHGAWLAEHVAGARAHLLDGHGHLSLAVAHFGEILDDMLDTARPSNVAAHSKT
jgi:pimeloyl-ACP methyl ester carboxylesterase